MKNTSKFPFILIIVLELIFIAITIFSIIFINLILSIIANFLCGIILIFVIKKLDKNWLRDVILIQLLMSLTITLSIYSPLKTSSSEIIISPILFSIAWKREVLLDFMSDTQGLQR